LAWNSTSDPLMELARREREERKRDRKSLFSKIATQYNHTQVNDIGGWPEGYLPIKCWPPIFTINFTIWHTQHTKNNKQEKKYFKNQTKKVRALTQTKNV